MQNPIAIGCRLCEGRVANLHVELLKRAFTVKKLATLCDIAFESISCHYFAWCIDSFELIA